MNSLRFDIYKFITDKYKVLPEYPWFNFPDHAVFRHADNKKWFALIMNLSKQKLGLDDDKAIDILNVKCEPLIIDSLLDEQGFLPAYHMHKGKWITILLDGSCPYEKICAMLEQSFKLTSGKAHKK